MAELGGKLDTDKEVENYRTGFEIVEPGWKTVVIVGSEVIKTKDGEGKFLEIKNQLQDGSGREVTDRLNIVNKSEVAQKIGRAQLSKIAQCIGHKGELANSDVLHGRPYDVKIAVKPFKSNTTGEMIEGNEITDYRPKGEGTSAPAEASTKDEASGW